MLARRLPFRPAPLTSAITRLLTGPVTGGVIASAVDAVDIVLTLTGAGTTLEGSVYTLNVAASGADAGTISAYEIDWGDGTVEAGSAGDNTHTYADGLNSYSIKVEATHATGVKRKFKSVTVTNVAPIVALSGAGTAYVDQEYTVTIGAATDPGDDTISNYRVNWGDGTYDDYATPGDKTHTYLAAEASVDITLDVTDEDGTYTAVDTLNIEVSAQVLPLFSRDYEATGSLGADATFTRASTATVTDFEGLVKTTKSGEARFEGLRRVENLLSASLANFANWTVFKTGAASTTTNGSKVTLDSPTASDRVFLYTTLTLAVGEYIFSFYIENIEDLSDLNDVLSNYGGGTATYSLINVPTYLDTSAKRVRLKINVTVAGTVVLRIGAGSSSAREEHATYFDPMLEDVTGQTNQNPSEYVSVGVLSAPYHGANVDGVKYFTTENGNTVTDNVVTEGTGAAITGGALLMEPAATNLVPKSTPANGVSNWNLVGAATETLNNAVAPDGTTTMTLINCGGAAFHSIAWQAFALTASTDFVVSVYAKQEDTGARNRFGVYTPAQAIWQAYIEVTWTSGVPSVTTSVTGSGSNLSGTIEQLGTTGIWRFVVAGTSAASTTGNSEVQLQPDRLAVSGVGTNFWGVNAATGTRTATSHIETSGSTVTRAADALSYSGIAADNETRAITDAGTVDVDDWDGVVDATINGADNLAQISSITVYTTGERPA